jgi:type I restriction enzyme, S subunit
MTNWTKYRIEQLIAEGLLTVGDGYRAKNSELGSDGLPFARASNINEGFHFDDADRFPEGNLDRAGEKISCPGDVVFTSKGTVGRFAFVRPEIEQFVYSPQLCYWRSLAPQIIDSRFLFYWMHGREFWLQVNGVKGQTDMADYVSLRDQRRMFITLPKIDEQKAIAAVLSAFDDKIELNRQMNATLEETARALFKSWFVDFDPVRRNQEARLFRKSLASAQPYDHLFPDRLEVDGNGCEVPEGWQVQPLGEVVGFAYGKSLTANNRFPGEIPVYGSNGQVGWHNEKLVDGPGIIVGRKGNPGAVVWSQTDFYPIDTTFYIVPTGLITSLYFLFFVLENQNLPSLSADSAVPGLNRNIAYRNLIACPPQPAFELFDGIARSIFDKIHANEKESRTLADLRDTLLPRLMSGRLRVPTEPEARLFRKSLASSQEHGR